MKKRSGAQVVLWTGLWGAAVSFVALLSPAVPVGWMLLIGTDPNSSVPEWLSDYMARATGVGLLGLIVSGLIAAAGASTFYRRGEF